MAHYKFVAYLEFCDELYIDMYDIETLMWRKLMLFGLYMIVNLPYFSLHILLIRFLIVSRTNTSLCWHVLYFPQIMQPRIVVLCCVLVTVRHIFQDHYSDVVINEMESQITNVSFVCVTVCSGAGQRKNQSCVPLAFVKGIHRWPVDSPHKGPVTWYFFHLMTSSCSFPGPTQSWEYSNANETKIGVEIKLIRHVLKVYLQ